MHRPAALLFFAGRISPGGRPTFLSPRKVGQRCAPAARVPSLRYGQPAVRGCGLTPADATLLAHQGHWLVRETIGLLRRTLSRLDVSSRSLFALIEAGSCFAGTYLELALACDRSYHLALPDDEAAAPKITVTAQNFGAYPMVTGESRLARERSGASRRSADPVGFRSRRYSPDEREGCAENPVRGRHEPIATDCLHVPIALIPRRSFSRGPVH